MKIVFVAPPFATHWQEKNTWITVPPKGYGGIQWIMKNLFDALVEEGHSVVLLGAPGSDNSLKNLEVVQIGEIEDIEEWLKNNSDSLTIVHDHSCRGIEFGRNINWGKIKSIHSHYLASEPGERINIVAASHSHAYSIGFGNAPFIRHPVNPKNYFFSEHKKDYLLYLGRVSDWKGTDCAALFAEKVGMKLIIAGPAWEKEYFDFIMNKYKNTIEYVGEIGGKDKLDLLSRATATLVLSKSVIGPANKIWVEPGSQVVSESAICGTPVISSDNGCLKEIVPYVGKVVNDPDKISKKEAEAIVSNLPTPKQTFDSCNEQWNYKKIAKEYIKIYEKVLGGEKW